MAGDGVEKVILLSL